MTRAHVALGSNLGDRMATLDAAVRALDADRDPHSLLDLLLLTEDRLGRVRAERLGPRTADLDLILYDGPPVSSPDLTVPHPRARERAFVLVPLMEVDPYASFPDGETAAEALVRLGPVRGVVPVGELEA